MMFLKRGNLRQSHDYRQIISKKVEIYNSHIECFAAFSSLFKCQTFEMNRSLCLPFFLYVLFFLFFSCFISNKFERVVRLPPICFCRSSSSSNFKTAELAKFKGFVFSSTSTLCYTTPHDDGMTKYKKKEEKEIEQLLVLCAHFTVFVYFVIVWMFAVCVGVGIGWSIAQSKYWFC